MSLINDLLSDSVYECDYARNREQDREDDMREHALEVAADRLGMHADPLQVVSDAVLFLAFLKGADA